MSISLAQNLYLGYASIALVVELSNVFLHLRQLFKIAGRDESSTLYLVNRWVNLVAFVTLRGSIQIFLTSKLMVHKDSVPFSVFIVGALCVIVVTIMTVVLFYRLLQSEFGSKTLANNNQSQIANTINDYATITSVSKNGQEKIGSSSSFTQRNGLLVKKSKLKSIIIYP